MLCVFVNEGVVYGIVMEELVFNDGDIVFVDCGVLMNDFYGDFVYIFFLGDVFEEVMELCCVINIFLYKGIWNVVVGNCLGDIGFFI